MSADEFGGLDLVLGSMRGYRGWRVTVEGKLEPLSQSGTWLPGENHAVCRSYGSEKQVPKIEGEDHADRRKRVEAWKSAHGMEACEHGFYAYFSAEDSEGHYHSGPCIRGVIEGYGEVLIGTKGFRASKARILAIAVEPHEGIWGLEQFVIDRLARNYPGVAMFQSALAMQSEFPADRAEAVAA